MKKNQQKTMTSSSFFVDANWFCFYLVRCNGELTWICVIFLLCLLVDRHACASSVVLGRFLVFIDANKTVIVQHMRVKFFGYFSSSLPMSFFILLLNSRDSHFYFSMELLKKKKSQNFCVFDESHYHLCGCCCCLLQCLLICDRLCELTFVIRWCR